jgi:ActR/RegA family two-component response regulator/anti-sigma regulatory factor (Ser/Thr protein kinase)
VLDEVTGALATRARRQGATLDQHLLAALTSVSVAHADRLTQVLTNLCLNAIEHAKQGDSVRVTAEVGQPGFVVLSVVDQGPGVPLSLRDGLFRDRVTTRPGGSGIGLPWSAELARQSGASLKLAASSAGAHFVVTWPFVGSSVRAAATAGGASTAGVRPNKSHASPPDTVTGKNLLLLEDDVTIAEMIEASLTARGAKLVVITSKRDLDEALARGPFHGVLLDLSPIADDPLSTLKTVKAACPDARIVLISGSIECLPLLSSDIVVSWVQKPFEMRDVIRALTAPLALGRTSDLDTA